MALVPVLLLAAWPGMARGAGEVTVPAVVDVRLDRALKAVKKADLAASHHDDVKGDRSRRWRSSWRVISQEPAAGAVVAAGTKVRLGVRHKSDLSWPGQAPVAVPDVTGLRLDKAKAALRKAYLRTESFDAVRVAGPRRQKDDRKWIVLSQDPGVEAMTGGGSVVRLGVRHQKDRIEAPAPEAPPTSAAVVAVAPSPVPQGMPPGDDTTVTRIIDGDTLVVAGGTRIRLIGLDTPEVSGQQGCFGTQASAHLAQLLPPGTALRLVYDAERHDRYGRTLAYLYRGSDGLFVNVAIARDGFAQQLTIAPNVTHAEEIRAGVADARAAGRGLWGACATDPMPAAAAATVKPAPLAPVLAPVPAAAVPAATGSCHRSYRGACVPIVSDVDCGEVSEKDIQVVGPDDYGLDADRDGIGCESRR